MTRHGILKNLKDKKIAVLMGGFGSEREISFRSGETIYACLKQAGYRVCTIDPDAGLLKTLKEEQVDLVYNMLHGKFGEDGQLQALLDFYQVPYTGENQLASALCFDKVRTKDVLRSSFYKTPSFFSFYNDDTLAVPHILDKISLTGIRYPCFLKPVQGGSSVGIKLVRTEDELGKIVLEYQKKGVLSSYFIEQYIAGKEITVGVYREKQSIRVLPILGLMPENEFYDYDAKYTPGKTKMEMPAQIPREVRIDLESVIQRVYNIFGFKSCVRVDIMLMDKVPYILEINTQPGMTETSDIPAMLKYAEIPLIDFILNTIQNIQTSSKQE